MKAKKKTRKVTLVLPTDLLEDALRSSGEGLAATVRQGLELISANVAYQKLRALRGKVKFHHNLNELRKD